MDIAKNIGTSKQADNIIALSKDRLNTEKPYKKDKQEEVKQYKDTESSDKKLENDPKTTPSTENKKEGEYFDTLEEAKTAGHVQTDILDTYKNAMISSNTIYTNKDIYKVINESEKYILKANDIDIDNEDDLKKLRRIKKSYNIMKKLGSEHPYFIKVYDIKEVTKNRIIRVETLMEHGGESLDKLMKAASDMVKKRWMIQSIDAFMYSEERRICHFDIKPQNMVFKNGILKIIDFEASVEFEMKDDLFKQLSISGKKAHEITLKYAPIEAMKEKDVGEWIGDKFDVYCWALSFYLIINNKISNNPNLIKTKERIENEHENDLFISNIKNEMRLLKIDKNGVISDVIARCLNYNPNIRPSFREIAELMHEIDKEVTSDDIEASIINNDIASTNNDIGLAYKKFTSNYSTALTYYEKSLRIHIKLLGEEHIDIATLYNDIGLLYNHLGNKIEALKYFERSLNIYIKLLGEEHINTATSYNNIGLVYNDLCEKTKALEYYEKSLQICQKFLAKEHISTAILYNNIGSIYYDLGKMEKALEFHRKSLTIRQKLLGKEHIDTAISYNNIGLVFKYKGENNFALKCHMESLAIYKKIFGEEHTHTATSYNNIGLVYFDLGEKRMALEYCKKSLDIRIKLLGEEHADTARSYSSVGSAYYLLSNKTQAFEYHKKALNIRLKLLGEEHIETAKSYKSIGTIYKHLNEKQKAFECYDRACRIFLCKLGAEHSCTISVKEQLDNIKF